MKDEFFKKCIKLEGSSCFNMPDMIPATCYSPNAILPDFIVWPEANLGGNAVY